MYLCYIDESGVPDIPGNTSHYVLVGVAIPVRIWKALDHDVELIKARYGLGGCELHVAWMLRKYSEQERITGFESLPKDQRIQQVRSARAQEVYRLNATGDGKRIKQAKKNFRLTEPYIHLTFDERTRLIDEVATTIASHGLLRIFGYCIDKTHFSPAQSGKTCDEEAFEQIVSRFEKYLGYTEASDKKQFGMLIHDNNETVAKKHTALMRKFHSHGTFWNSINHIIETPLFVDSALTSMIQIADLCSFALRRYLEKQETRLFDILEPRFDRNGTNIVGVKHFANQPCQCKICI